MAKKRFTFADAKERIKELEETVDDLQAILKEEFDAVEDRVTRKDYYQGAALGAIITAVLFIAGILLF